MPARRRWTRSKMVHAANVWVERYGKAPKSTEWAPSSQGSFKRERWTGEFPVASLVMKEFGTWARFLAAAGLIRHCSNPMCGAPRPRARTDGECERCRNYRRRSLGRAWRPRGVVTAERKAQIIEDLKRFMAEHGRPPLSTDLRSPPPGYPSTATVLRNFGSWNAALRTAGLPTARKTAVALREKRDD